MVATTTKGNGKPQLLDHDQVTNGGDQAVDLSIPFRISATIIGTAPLLFHAWNNEAVAEKAGAAKNSRAKKEDNVSSYVYPTEEGELGIPGKNIHAALVEAGRYMPDPRSPRKSARDLVRAGIIPLTVVAPLIDKQGRAIRLERDEKGTFTGGWDYLDRQRVTVQRAGITRTRPAMLSGWEVSFEFLVGTPEYLSPQVVGSLLNQAGRLVGLCDFRPTYGRFAIKRFEALAEDLTIPGGD